MQPSPLRWALLPGIFLVAALLYLPALSGGFFFDDFPNIVDEGSVKVPDLSLPYLLEAALPLDLASGTRPLSRLSFALNWYVSGMDAAAFKLVNIGLHGCNAVLVFLFLRLLLYLHQAKRPQTRLPSPVLLAAIAAPLWAAAPIHANTPRSIVRCITDCPFGHR